MQGKDLSALDRSLIDTASGSAASKAYIGRPLPGKAGLSVLGPTMLRARRIQFTNAKCSITLDILEPRDSSLFVLEQCVFWRTAGVNGTNEHICAQMSDTPIQSPEEIAKTLGQRVRARRLSANVTQAALADKAGISRRALVQLESGQGSTLYTLICVLKALGLEQQLSSIAPVPTVSPMAMLKATRLRNRAS